MACARRTSTAANQNTAEGSSSWLDGGEMGMVWVGGTLGEW